MKIVEHLKKLGIIESVRGRLVLYFLLLLVIPLSAVTYIQYADEKQHLRDRALEQLSSIADTRKRNIENWLSERTGDVSLLSKDVLLRDSLAALMKKGKYEEEARRRGRDYTGLQTHLDSFVEHVGYSGAELIDSEGRVVVSSSGTGVGESLEGVDYFEGALRAGPAGVYIKDIFIDKKTDNPTMGFSQAIVSEAGGAPRVLGVAVLFFNLDKDLFPLVLDWPGKGRTGETLLVTRKGDEVIFLNRLKYVDVEPTFFKIPASRGWPLPAIYSSGGLEGSIIAVDYRGMPVIAAYRYISRTKWGFVAKIDESEAMAPIYRYRQWTVLFLLVTAVLVVVLMLLLSRKLVEPIEILAENTRKIAKGDFTVELPEGGRDEIGELTRSFKRMADALKVSDEEVKRRGGELEEKNRELEALAESLEEKVKSRTHELEGMNLAQAEILRELDARTGALEKSREDLKEFAKKLEESRNRVSENLEIVERANVELRRIDYMKDQFLGIISHELRTPLSLIMGYASNMLTSPAMKLQPEVEEEAEGIYKGAERLKNIITEMLDVSRIDARGLSLIFEKVDIGGLMNDVLTELGPFVSERKQRLEVADFSGLPQIPLDRRRMHQVLLNVIGNAIKFTPDGGRIEIQNRVHRVDHGLGRRVTEVLAEHLDIVIKDTGIGLDKGEVENIFEKFYEVGEIEKHTTSKYRFLGRGVGLGLPIARGIVEAHGGWLWAESEGYDPVKCPGSSFHIMLPLTQRVVTEPPKAPEAVETARSEAAGAVARREGESGGRGFAKPVVLLIEDDMDLMNLTELILRGKYDIRKAMDGYEGIRIARDIMPDLILLDVYMEGLNGYKVCEILKNDPETKDITIALFTAGVQKWEVDKGFSSGADDYITKPFKPAELIAKVDELTSGRMAVKNNSVD